MSCYPAAGCSAWCCWRWDRFASWRCGRPERVLSLWLAPRFTVVTVGAWALLASGALATFFALASNGIGARLPLFVVLVASVAAVIAGVVTAVYTGVLLMQLPSVVAFGSWLVPALFCLSSLSCGVAVAFGVASFVDSRVPFGSALRCLSHMDRAIIIAGGQWLWPSLRRFC